MRNIERRVQKLEKQQTVSGDFLNVVIRKDESEYEAFLRACDEHKRPPGTIKYVALIPADITDEEWDAEYGR